MFVSEVNGSQKLQTMVITVGRHSVFRSHLRMLRAVIGTSPGPLCDSLEQTRASWMRAEGQRCVDLDALQLSDEVTQIHSLKSD